MLLRISSNIQFLSMPEAFLWLHTLYLLPPINKGKQYFDKAATYHQRFSWQLCRVTAQGRKAT
ncbi:hypothetical protein N752_00910 [Desulforamulus aquiferis]|nr:hypothetical protein N752_00910 [Desulforamulus aquiferis]